MLIICFDLKVSNPTYKAYQSYIIITHCSPKHIVSLQCQFTYCILLIMPREQDHFSVTQPDSTRVYTI